MNWGFLFFTVVLAVLGAVCLYFRRKYQSEIALMAAIETSRAGDVAKIPEGTLVEVKGTIRCDAPLTGQFSELPCVYSRSTIEREERRRKDGQDETTYHTESDVENHAIFWVEDASGRVAVDCQGASVEAPMVHDRTGNKTLAGSVASLAVGLLGGLSTAYRYREYILAPDQPVYVLGTTRSGGGIGAASPQAARSEFIVTHKSEEERAKSSRTTTIILLVVAVLLFAGAAASLWATFKYAVK
jgi:hypothetical protein